MAHIQILCLHLWIFTLLCVIATNKALTDWSLGFNFALLITQVVINLAFWRTKP